MLEWSLQGCVTFTSEHLFPFHGAAVVVQGGENHKQIRVTESGQEDEVTGSMAAA